MIAPTFSRPPLSLLGHVKRTATSDTTGSNVFYRRKEASLGMSELPVSAAPSAADIAAKAEAVAFLRSLLNKNLQIQTTDGRLFRGEFKCADPDRNLVLAQATEHRQPSPKDVARAKKRAATAAASTGKIVLDMTSRYLGLIVVPGQHIVSIKVEQFASQMT